jgi:diacylglycerol O-acyltransferase
MPHLDQVVTLRGIPGVPRAAGAARRLRRTLRQNADGDILPGPTVLAPKTKTSGKVSPRRSVAFTSTPLAEVKSIKNHFGVSVNDTIMALVAGGLRRWLADHRDLPDDPLAAMVPVSVRLPHEPGFGNKIAMMIPAVHSEEADPVKRLMLTHETMRSAKERHRAVPATLLQDANHFIPPAVFARAAQLTFRLSTSRMAAPTWNLVISNVPGPQIPLYCAGAQLVANYPVSVITDGMGLNITVMSYCGNLDFGIVADREQMPDVKKLIGWLADELDALMPAPTRPAGTAHERPRERTMS